MTKDHWIQVKFVTTKIKHMKIKLITTCLLFSASLFSQITLKNNGKVVKELTCDMTKVDLTLTLPKEAQNYERFEILIERYRSEDYDKISLDYEWTSYRNKGFYKNYSSADIKGKSIMNYTLLDGEKSDFSYGWHNKFNLSDVCDDKFRDYENVYHKITYFGATHTGWKWENDKQVKTYEWSVISHDYFKLKIGTIDPDSYNTTGNIGIPKTMLSKGDVQVRDEDNSIQMEVYEEKEGTMDMGGAPSESITNGTTVKVAEFSGTSKATIMAGIEADIIRRSNYYYTNYLTPQGPFLFMHNKDRLIHMGAVLGAKAGGTESKSNSKFGALKGKLASAYGVGGVDTDKAKEDIQKMIDNSGEYFTWTKETVNGIEYDVLEVAVYDKKQTELNGKKNPALKSGEKENSKKLKYYVHQKGESVYVIGMAQTGSATQLEKAKDVWNNFPASVKIK